MINEIKKIILDTIGNPLSINTEDIADDFDLRDLGLNSLNIVRIIIAIEKYFDIEISDENIYFKNWSTLKKIVDIVEKEKNDIKR